MVKGYGNNIVSAWYVCKIHVIHALPLVVVERMISIHSLAKELQISKTLLSSSKIYLWSAYELPRAPFSCFVDISF